MVDRAGHAEVIGGGIAGLTAASALARTGWSVRLHEQEESIRAIGAGIYIWSNGLAVLEALGVFEEAVRGAHLGPVAETRDGHNRTVERFPINGPGQPRLYTVVRERLIGALAGAARRAGAEIVTGSAALRATPDGEVVFADGGTAKADLVVAADGINSPIRDSLGLPVRRVRMDQGATRMLVPRRPGFVPPADQAKYVEYFSGSRRVLYTPSSADQLYVALVCATGDEAARRVPIDKAAWTASFPHLAELIAHLDGPARWDRFELLELGAWSAGRVAVLGDAAHAQPPYLGQGGGCAMMNALGLAHAVRPSEAPLTERLRAWEAAERRVIQHTQRFSYRLGHLNAIPEAPRTVLLSLLNRSRWLARQRLRAATTVPTGFDLFAAGRRAS